MLLERSEKKKNLRRKGLILLSFPSSLYPSLFLSPLPIPKTAGRQISSIGGDGISRPSAIIPGIEASLWAMSQADLEASLIRGVRIRVLPVKKKGTKKKNIYICSHTGREQRCSIPSIDFRHQARTSISSFSFSPPRNLIVEQYFVVSLVTVAIIGESSELINCSQYLLFPPPRRANAFKSYQISINDVSFLHARLLIRIKFKPPPRPSNTPPLSEKSPPSV